MKELSIEEKAKRFDEVLAMAKECITHIPDEAVNKYMLNMFPELKESDDEKIRKELLSFCKDRAYYFPHDPKYANINNWIAWLEKQGEQNPVDKAESKFKVGDWVIDKQGLVHQIENVVENITNHTFGYDIVGGGYFNDNSDVRLWTIKDAKNGDVLKEDSCIFVIERMKPNGTAIVHCCLFDDGEFDLTGSNLRFDVDTTRPATKEQRDQLEKAMFKAGYKWDEDKKELKKL